MILSFRAFYDCWVVGSQPVVGLGLRGVVVVPVPSDHRLTLSGARFSRYHFSA